jgi:glutathione S-transferase
MAMRLYIHPVSNTSRPIMHYIADNNLDIEEYVIDLMNGEHHQEPYISLNPNRLVPTLVDGDFILSESSAILKYLADKFDLPTYPKDLKKRAKVNEIMDWFNTGFYRDYAYGVVYPQIFPHHKRPRDEVHAGTIAWGRERTRNWLKILNDHWLGIGNKYLVGDELTIADYFGAALLTCGEPIRAEFKDYPNIQHWLERVQSLPNWGKVNEAVAGFRESLKDQKFETV